MPTAIICDIDNTLSLCGERSPYATEQCMKDAVNIPVAAVLRLFAQAGYPIVFVTGRSERYQNITLAWLTKHQIPFHGVYMRVPTDKRQDTLVKQELYETHIRPFYQILFVLEDRKRVCEMWRKCGLTVFQVAEGNY